MKKILSVFLIAVMLLCTGIPAYAKNAFYPVTYDVKTPATISVGEEFTVSIGVDKMKNLALSGRIDISFDTFELKYISSKGIGDDVDSDDFSQSSPFASTVNDTKPGKVIIAYCSYDVCPEDYVKIIEIKFRALSSGNTDISISTVDLTVEIDGVEYCWDSGSGAQTHTLSVTDGNTPAPAPEIIIGDVNGDRKVTAADARLTLRTSAKIDTFSEEQNKVADVNFDNKITAADARMILRVAAKIDSFDIPESEDKPKPTMELSESEIIAYVGGSTSFYANVKGIDDYNITAEFSADSLNCKAEDVDIKVTETTFGAFVYIDISDMVLNTRLIGANDYYEKFVVVMSLEDNDGNVLDVESVNIEIRYSDEYIKKYGSLVYLTNYLLQPDSKSQCFELLFAFENLQGEDVASFGFATVDIMNDAGEIVYSGKHEFMPEDFALRKTYKEEVLFGCIEIPYNEISKGASAYGTVKLNIYTPFNVVWEKVIFAVANLPVDETLVSDDPEACIEYGHLVSSGLCTRCSSYQSSDISFFFGDEDSGLLPAETTCNIFGRKTAATINRITDVTVAKNYSGNYDIIVTADVDVTIPAYSGDSGYFNVCLIDGYTNTTVMSGLISYNRYGKQTISFNIDNVKPGLYAVMFMSIDISN